ncbi:hypothetical protein B0H13DRAFT_2232401 [Mycena leptocephala]|nr:hypothetical protein B0H13DRAFT_2232401 [Mycena leptocephala]
MLRRDGTRNANHDLCLGCRVDACWPEFRCRDCFGDDLLCSKCMVDRHKQNPLHAIEQYTGELFEQATLKSLGLRVQLGHPPREYCAEPKELHSHFVVLHTNGIHEVAVDACECEHQRDAGEHEEQLLRAGWFPATDQNPRTCAMFAVWTCSWSRRCRRRPPCTISMPCWRNSPITLVAGRAHSRTSIYGTKVGELAVYLNLPDNWHDAPPESRFLYTLFLAMDACFRLKRRLVSSELKDPALGSGWAYTVETGPYRKYLLTVTDQKEMSTCSGLAALDYANTKFSRGYSATGVGMGVCAYSNMDYIFACILVHIDPRLLKIISYDIVCQWWINLKKCLKELPPLIWLVLIMNLIRFVIPKMHIHSHTLACQLLFSLNLVPGSAQTDGGGIERPWAHIGGVATNTRKMGPGSREDILNCHWGFWNWQKLLGLGERLRTRMERARNEYSAQLEGFTQFSVQQVERVPEWRAMVEAFEANNKKPNPYEMTMRHLSEAEVLLQFEKEEAERVEGGVPGIHSVSPSSFIAAGLEVEDQQRRVWVQVQIDVAALCRKLNHSIHRFRTLQATYTPAAINVPDNEQAENVPLFLPSALTTQQQAMEPLKGLTVIEDSLRNAQCSTALAHHQGANTRSRTIVARNESKIHLHSEKYQMAWEAKRKLADGNAEEVGWRMLREGDIRCMEDAEEIERGVEKRKAQMDRRRRREDELQANGELPPLTPEELADRARALRGGENVREVSWIWTAAGSAGTDAELEEGKCCFQ